MTAVTSLPAPAKAERNPGPDARAALRRDAVVLALLVGLHEICHRALAGGALVSSLLAPGGIQAALTLAIAVLFVTLRLALFVGVPAWIAAQLALALSRRCLYRG